MTPYIIALGALALLLAWSEKGRDRGNGYQPNGPKSHKPPPPPTTGSNAQRPSEIVGTVVNVEEDEKGVKFTILLAGDQTVKTDKERQNRKTKDFAKSSTPKKHGSTLRHTTEKQKNTEGGQISVNNTRKIERSKKSRMPTNATVSFARTSLRNRSE